MVRFDRTGQGKARQVRGVKDMVCHGKEIQGRTGEHRSWKDRTGLGRTGQGRTGHEMAGQGMVRQCLTGDDRSW